MVRQTSSTGETILHYIDEVDHLDEVRPSSVAKNTLADLRISFAFSNSAICFFNRLISACAFRSRPGRNTGVDIGPLLPQPQRLRIDSEPPSDMASRSEIRRMIGARFGEHPQRTLTKFGRVRVSHSSILQKDKTERNPGRFRDPSSGDAGKSSESSLPRRLNSSTSPTSAYADLR